MAVRHLFVVPSSRLAIVAVVLVVVVVVLARAAGREGHGALRSARTKRVGARDANVLDAGTHAHVGNIAPGDDRMLVCKGATV